MLLLTIFELLMVSQPVLQELIIYVFKVLYDRQRTQHGEGRSGLQQDQGGG